MTRREDTTLDAEFVDEVDMGDVHVGETRRLRSSQDWDAIVDEHVALLWATALRCASSPLEALELCQLAWLRLELATRNGSTPQDRLSWLIDQVREGSVRNAGV